MTKNIIHNNINIFFLILIIFPHNILSQKECTKLDYKQYFSPCDENTNTRIVQIYKISNCTNISPSTILNIYKNLPTFNVTCDFICQSGTKIIYDVLDNKLKCEKCPENTYNNGGDLIIKSYWKEEHLKLFKINCYSINANNNNDNINDIEYYNINNEQANINCSGMTINKDRTNIESGELSGDNNNNNTYILQMMYFFNAKNSGRFIIKYKKESFKEKNNYINGDLKIYLDYNLISHDNYEEHNEKYITLYKDFEKGEHEINIFYSYTKNNDNDLKFLISEFEIIGIENAATECIKCERSIAPEGSDRCYACEENNYFNENSMTCEKCKENEYSFPNMLNGNKCFKKKECDEYDYEIKNITFNNNNESKKIIIYYDVIEPSFCIKNENFKNSEEIELNNNDFEDSNDNNDNFEIINESKCQSGYSLTSYFKYDFKKKLLSNFFDKISGFKTNGNKIFIGNFNNNINENYLKKKILITNNNAYFQITFSLNLNKNENFEILINEKKTFSYSDIIKENITLSIPLDLNENNLYIRYKKEENFLKTENSVSISTIEIFGSNLSKKKKVYKKCPEGFISNEKCEFCIKCNSFNETSVDNKCVEKNCPKFTYKKFFDDNIGNECILTEMILYEKRKLKFNLNQLKLFIKELCEVENNKVFCNDNNFLGPISDEKNNNNIKSNEKNNNNDIILNKNLFFISIFNPSKPKLFDIDYDFSNNKYKNGFIFALFSENDNNNDNQNNVNILSDKKKLKNLAHKIKSVKIFDDDKENNNYFNIKNGILIEYEESDECLLNPSKNYKSFLYLKCSLDEISSPILKRIDKENCIYYFQINTPYACKNCVINELKYYEKGTCRNSKRKYFFYQNDNCLFFYDIYNANIDDENYIEKNDNNDLILFKNNSQMKGIYDDFHTKNLNNRNLKLISINNKIINKFNFEYIENEVFSEKCSFYENIQENYKFLIFLIPFIYILTIICIIYVYIKYKKVENEYKKLNIDYNKSGVFKGDSNLFETENNNNDNRVVGISSTGNEDKKINVKFKNIKNEYINLGK